MRKISLRTCLSSSHLWVMAATPLLPLNVLVAIVFWLLRSGSGREPAADAARSLNIQLTYSLVFAVPLFLAYALSSLDEPDLEEAAVEFYKLATGFPLGLVSLAGIVLLVAFNVRNFAGQILDLPVLRAPRIPFVRE